MVTCLVPLGVISQRRPRKLISPAFHGPEVFSSSETEEPIVDAFLVAGKADAACQLKSRTMNFVSVLAFLRLVGQLAGLADVPVV